jgi:hypothetical protein
MNNHLPGYGLPVQSYNPDTYGMMQAQTAANNAVSAHYQSQKRLAKNINESISDSNITAVRNQLFGLPITPLRKSLEITNAIPIGFLPVKAQKFVKAAALALGVSVEMVGACLLGASLIAARGNFWVKVDERWSEMLTGILMVAAPSGERKSAVVELMRPVFKEFEAELQMGFNQSEGRIDLRVRRKTLARMEQDLAKNLQKKMITNGYDFDKARSELHSECAAVDRLRKSVQTASSMPRILLDTPTLEALAVELGRQEEALGMFEAEGGLLEKQIAARHRRHSAQSLYRGVFYLRYQDVRKCASAGACVCSLLFGST